MADHLLPLERDMFHRDWKPGDLASWIRVDRGGYGLVRLVPVVVVRVTASRVRVRAPIGGGGFKEVIVLRNSLTPRAAVTKEKP